MRLTVVGCSGSYPGPDSAASCYLVEEDDASGRAWRILLDLGSGALGALQRYADPLAVDAVFLSHLHPDHCMDLCGYHVLRRYHPAGPQPRIPVHGPAGTADRMAAAYGLEPQPGMTEEFDFHDLGEPVEVGPLTVTPMPVVHPVPAFGFQVEAGGRSLAYSGDTGPGPELDAVARNVDLLLAEASFLSEDVNPPAMHLTGADCGRAAATGAVGRLVLTHVPPWHDPEVAVAEARARFDGDILLASPGATYLV
ncbi:MAG: MBL fold metallo-hydrolase [Nocardioides sp.]